nr:hypothetical protein [Tanacetum cinerariifolium]
GDADVLGERDATRSKNGEDNHDSGTGVKRQTSVARECTYSDFMKCKPLYFKGTEGVVKTVGHDVAYAMTWTNLKKKMTDKYCPRGEIKKLKELALMRARMFPEESDKIERCKFHHNGQCTVKYANCKRVGGHLTRECRSPAATNNQRNLACYECGNQGHYRSDCPELRNQNRKNQAGGTGARGMMHALGGGETNQDLNSMENDINA